MIMIIQYTGFKTILQGIQSLLVPLQIHSKQEYQVFVFCQSMESIYYQYPFTALPFSLALESQLSV